MIHGRYKCVFQGKCIEWKIRVARVGSGFGLRVPEKSTRLALMEECELNT